VLSGIEGAAVVGGVSALSAALFSIGIPKDSVLEYEEAIKADNFVVTVQGSIEEIEHARSILKASPVKKLDVHDYRELKMAS
jgi:hypothetical protein